MIKWWLRVFSLHHFPYQVKNVQGVLSYAWYLRWLIFGCSTNIACHACLTELIQISRQCNIQNQIQSNEGSGSGWTPSTDWRNTEVCKYGNQSSWSPKVRPLETIQDLNHIWSYGDNDMSSFQIKRVQVITTTRVRIALAKNAGCLQNGLRMLLLTWIYLVS